MVMFSRSWKVFSVILSCSKSANSNINSSSLTYKTMKFMFQEIFLSLFREDPSMATYGKTTWKQFNVY